MNVRALCGQMGGYATASRYDGREMTAPARAGFLARFYRQVDPAGVLPMHERERRAQAALKLYMRGLALAKRAKRLRAV